MAKVYLTCVASEIVKPYARRNYQRLLQYALKDTTNKHILTDNPLIADLIVFVDSSCPNFTDIRSSPLFRSYKHKTVIYDSADQSIPTLPGVYVNIENLISNRLRKSILSGYYLRVTDNYLLDNNQSINKARYLFSFIGNSLNDPVRLEVCQLSTNNAFIKDTSVDDSLFVTNNRHSIQDRQTLFLNVLFASKFVLCPRGFGPSTWRLFEVMRAGRVPVIISDNWVRPVGPCWDSFSITIKESDIYLIPSILEAYEYRAEELGCNARTEWQRWYSENVVFTTIVDDLLNAHQCYLAEGKLRRICTYVQYLKPKYLRLFTYQYCKLYLKRIIDLFK